MSEFKLGTESFIMTATHFRSENGVVIVRPAGKFMDGIVLEFPRDIVLVLERKDAISVATAIMDFFTQKGASDEKSLADPVVRR